MSNNKNLENNKMAKKSSESTPSVVVQKQETVSVAAPVKSEAKAAKVQKATSVKKEEVKVEANPVVQTQSTTPAPATVKKVVKAPSKKTEVAAPVATPEPVKQEAASEKKAPKVKKASPVAKVETPAVQTQTAAPVQVNTEAPAPVEITGVQALFDAAIAQVEEMVESQRTMVSNLRKGWKLYQKESKESARSQERQKRLAKKDPNRKKREPTGFALASQITPALCQFLDLPAGTKLPRTQVTKKVTDYIRTQNLQNPEKKRSFVPDSKLGAILGPLHQVDKERGYDYFNLQRYLTPHFIKSTVAKSQ
jgi:chromatin remodeling complex protein RSC6